MWWHTEMHGTGSEGGNWRMQWVASTLHTTSEHGVSSITTADGAHLGCQQSSELTPPAYLNGLISFVQNSAVFTIRLSLAWFWRAFRISGGGFEHPKTPPRYATANCNNNLAYILTSNHKTVIKDKIKGSEYKIQVSGKWCRVARWLFLSDSKAV